MMKVDESIDNVARKKYYIHNSVEVLIMKKTFSMSIRVSEEELEILKRAAELQSYSSYSEFVRRTALIEAKKIIKDGTMEIGWEDGSSFPM